MRPDAHVATVYELLPLWWAEKQPLDRFLHYHMRSRRHIGAKDRQAIRALAYHIIRHWYRLTWQVGQVYAPTTGEGYWRRLLIAALLLRGEDAASLFTGSRYGLPVLLPDEQDFIERLKELTEPPAAVTSEAPAWFHKALRLTPSQWQTLTQEAPTDIRVNTLKASREEVLTVLQQHGVAADIIAYTSAGIRLHQRYPLDTWQVFQKGWIEVQDASSQVAAEALQAKAGMQVLDYCAGAGGKTLAIAAAMQNKGRITATDSEQKRLDKARERLARAGVDTVTCRLVDAAWRKKHKGHFDRVLVDAPCTGSGTWRRNPDGRLRTTPETVARFQATQRQILAEVVPLLKTGGQLLYATCSLLPDENDAQASWLAATYPALKPVPLLGRIASGLVTDLLQHTLQLTPWQHGCDGFFFGVWEKV